MQSKPSQFVAESPSLTSETGLVTLRPKPTDSTSLRWAVFDQHELRVL
jgi:hypothetical protein